MVYHSKLHLLQHCQPLAREHHVKDCACFRRGLAFSQGERRSVQLAMSKTILVTWLQSFLIPFGELRQDVALFQTCLVGVRDVLHPLVDAAVVVVAATVGIPR